MADEKKGMIAAFIRPEKLTLVIVTVSGIIYNVGMTAGPWLEGKLAQYLCDIIRGSRTFGSMAALAFTYVLVILLVQIMRYVKRLYVRKFANQVNRDMKEELYRSMLAKSQIQLEKEGIGSLMTKAAADVDACVEGIRKFTTEIFDTGVVMLAYLTMLLGYDWRLTLLAMLFPPVAYGIANRLKGIVTRSARAYKESEGLLNSATYDRVGNAVTYRIYGRETGRDEVYEECLQDYEKKAVRANIWENSMQPVYQVISMIGAVCILWFGGKNVLGEGWTSWDIAAFVTFLSCFTKLASKSSKAAKLFNSVQKAAVSWKRIEPLLSGRENGADGGKCPSIEMPASGKSVMMENVSFSYPNGAEILSNVSFSAGEREIIGVTGPVACGKSTLGKLFLENLPYEGKISLRGSAVYMGHEPELICGTIEENILLGLEGDAWEALSWVKMDEEVRQMPEGIHSRIGNGGVTLSGGQQARIALARTLFHRKEFLVLDDPFSAVDMQTEREIFENIKRLPGICTVLILSHRLALFSEMDQVLWMSDGRVTVSSHDRLTDENPEYAYLYRAQNHAASHRKGGSRNEE